MRIAIVGAGGVGGHLAVRLAAAGNAVGALARGPHLGAIRERGLTLRTPADEATVRLAAAAADGAALAGALGLPELVIFAVKGQDLDGAMAAAAPLMERAHALPFLNGVEAPDRLAARFGAERVLIGIARIGAHIEAPGLVVQTTPEARYSIGDRAGGRAAPVPAIRTVFEGAGIRLLDEPDIRVDLWKKFVMLAAFAGVTAGARCDARTIGRTPALRGLYLDIAREVVALAAAEGVTLPADMPESGLAFVERMGQGVRSSMSHDLDHGKPLELDWLNGAVPRLAARHGLATPVNATVAALLEPFKTGRPRS